MATGPPINILGDALDLRMIALNFFMQRKEVKGMPVGAPCLKASKEVSRVYLGVNGFWVPELPYPCVRNDGEHELCRLPSRGVIRSAVRAPCLVCRLEACPDDGRCVVVDLEVISPGTRGFGEGLAVALEVRRLRADNSDQVVRPTRFVVRDLQ